MWRMISWPCFPVLKHTNLLDLGSEWYINHICCDMNMICICVTLLDINVDLSTIYLYIHLNARIDWKWLQSISWEFPWILILPFQSCFDLVYPQKVIYDVVFSGVNAYFTWDISHIFHGMVHVFPYVPLCSTDFSMVSDVFHSLPMVFLWFSHFPMIFSWFSHSFPMVS